MPGWSATTIATSVVTPVAGLWATAPATLTRPWWIRSAACSRERASRRRTSSASSRRRRGTRSAWLVGARVESPSQPGVGLLEGAHVLVERPVVQPLHGLEHLVDVGDPGPDGV